MNPPGGRLRGIALTVLSSILWGTSFIFIEFGLRFTDPYTLLFLRFALASAFVIPISVISQRFALLKELKKPGIWILGAAWTVGFIFQFAGQSYSSAAEASLLSDLYPAIVPLLAFAFLKDRISRLQKLSTIMGFAGLFIVVLPGVSFGSLHFFGDVLLFLSSFAYAVFIVLGKKDNTSTPGAIFALILVTTLMLVVPAVFLGNLESIRELAPEGWLVVLWLAIPATLLATSLFLSGLRYLAASNAATIMFLELVTGFVLSVLVFGEPDVLVRSVGAVVISISIIISSLNTKSENEKDIQKDITIPGTNKGS